MFLNEAAVECEPTPAKQDIDDFIYLMSHDVRASVRALLELPQWIVEDLEEAGIRVEGSVAQSIELMNRHTARLDRMLIDLLAYSRVGRMQEVRRVDVGAALDEVLGTLALPEGFEVIREIDCDICVMGVEDISTLWSALIGNAVKHHDKRSGRITVATRGDADTIRFIVSDDGPGIPQTLHDKALNALTTLRPRDEVEGTGMGLANVRKMSEHYGGTVHLASAQSDGSGLRIEISLPRGT